MALKMAGTCRASVLGNDAGVFHDALCQITDLVSSCVEHGADRNYIHVL